jgi:hypothetical protein
MHARAAVIEVEPFANLAGFYPDARVGARFIGCRPSKQLNADRSLFKVVPVAGESFVDDVSQEFLAALTGVKLYTLENSLKLLANSGFLHGATVSARTLPHTFRHLTGLLAQATFAAMPKF